MSDDVGTSKADGDGVVYGGVGYDDNTAREVDVNSANNISISSVINN